MIEVEMFFRDSITAGVAMVRIIIPGATAGAAIQSDFSCESKAVAINQPGPHWSRFQMRLSDHPDYVKAQM
jgi:hypothetical protein